MTKTREWLWLGVVIVLAVSGRAWALQADELLLLVNSSNPSSQRCAEFYAKARGVPAGRILALNLPNNDDISFVQYERDVVPPVRAFLRRNGLAAKVKCIVTFYGVPLRIGAWSPTPAEHGEIADLRQLQDQTVAKVGPVVQEAEELARAVSAGFEGGGAVGAAGVDQLLARGNKAIGAVLSALQSGNAKARQELPKLIGIMSKLGGDAEVLRLLADENFAKLLDAKEMQRWTARRAELAASQGEVQTLQEQRYDGEARRRMREVVPQAFGLLGLVNLLKNQMEYLSHDGTVAAFDSELSMLWLDYYSRKSALPNPINHMYLGQMAIPTMMVMRLDGPGEAIVQNIILMGLRAEKEGLQGRFAIDSTGGAAPSGGVDKAGGYSAFDKRLMNLQTMVSAHTKIPITLDTKHPVFPPGSVKDVGLYCGWYSVRNYVPAFSFKPGAVGYHVASFEAVSLRMEGERGWCAGLLADGITSTLGAVAEPYLHAFPPPDEFFPLLLTGKATLAEVYWTTLPAVSWMMLCVGDPLYTPFKVNPQMRVEDLPEQLRGLFVKKEGNGAGQ